MSSVTLSVSDVERLAKAGVKVEMCEVIPVPDTTPPVEALSHHMPRPLADLIWDRWKRTKGPDLQNYSFHVLPFQLFASEHGEKAYVFVQPQYEPPFIIEDERCIFPSDALMAKLALLEKK